MPSPDDILQYVQHQKDCTYRDWFCSQPGCGLYHAYPCDCGLNKLIDEWFTPFKDQKT
jgi:hypothetical protein